MRNRPSTNSRSWNLAVTWHDNDCREIGDEDCSGCTKKGEKDSDTQPRDIQVIVLSNSAEHPGDHFIRRRTGQAFFLRRHCNCVSLGTTVKAGQTTGCMLIPFTVRFPPWFHSSISPDRDSYKLSPTGVSLCDPREKSCNRAKTILTEVTRRSLALSSAEGMNIARSM